MSEQTHNDLLSFLGNSQADTEASVQSHEEVEEELDYEDSSTEEDDSDGYESEEYEEDSTADYNEEEESDDEGEESEAEEAEPVLKATDIDDEDFTITVDGEELSVKGSELKSGYMRREAFTKKTQEVANQRKALDAELTKAVERSEAVKFNATIEMEKLDGILKQLGGWDNLKRQATPQEYDQFHRAYITTKQSAEMAEDIYRETVESMKENNSNTIKQIFKDLASTRSDFTKDTMQEMNSFLTNKGFTEDMVLSITDVAAWDMILDAMAYSKLQARTTETVKSTKNEKLKTKSHQAAPVKKAVASTGNKDFERALKKQKYAKGREQSELTRDLIRKLL